MTTHRVLHFENPKDRKVLKSRCRPVKLPDKKLKSLIDDMFETMHANDGLGLAAPQIGRLIRLLVICIPAEVEKLEDGTEREIAPKKELVMINPRIIKMGPEEMVGREGCLSLPGWFADVPRAAWVTVEYQDLQGRTQRVRRAEGMLSRAIQHEIDHLDGIFFTERIRDFSTMRDYREGEEGSRLIDELPEVSEKEAELKPELLERAAA